MRVECCLLFVSMKSDAIKCVPIVIYWKSVWPSGCVILATGLSNEQRIYRSQEQIKGAYPNLSPTISIKIKK